MAARRGESEPPPYQFQLSRRCHLRERQHIFNGVRTGNHKLNLIQLDVMMRRIVRFGIGIKRLLAEDIQLVLMIVSAHPSQGLMQPLLGDGVGRHAGILGAHLGHHVCQHCARIRR